MRTTPPVIGLVVLLSGCSPAVTTAPPAEPLGADPFTPCADVFRPGQIIFRAEALTACAATDGTSRTPQYLRCVDGRRLWRIDETMSPTPGWGFGGNTFQATTGLGSDPDLTAALHTCRARELPGRDVERDRQRQDRGHAQLFLDMPADDDLAVVHDQPRSGSG